MKIEGVVTGQWRRRNVMDSMESSMLSFTESQLKLDSNTALVNQASSKFGQNTVVGKVCKIIIKLDGFSCLSL